MNGLGHLKAKYPSVNKAYTVSFTYDNKGRTVSLNWTYDESAMDEKSKLHGKYFLRTNLDREQENNIWSFYNVICTVEETFKTLDIRSVYHKSNERTKGYLNLAILAYWVVSTTKYRLKFHSIHVQWSELLRIMSSQVRVTAQFEREDGKVVNIRQSTLPEDILENIYLD